MGREGKSEGMEEPSEAAATLEEHGRKEQLALGEMKKQLHLAGPIVTANLLIYGLQVISIMFVGHLGDLPLSGASMATSFASVTGFSLLIGLGSAMETFCGQSYGAKQYHMLGIHMQRAMIVLLLASLPLAFFWFNAGHILAFLGQDPEISAEAGRYARFMIPTIFAYALFQCLIRFLQAQNNVGPMVFIAGFTTCVHIFVCRALVFNLGLGNKGAALANAISYWINVLLLAFYIRVSPSCKETWTGFSKEALNDIMKYLWLAFPSAVMLCLETWSFEMMVLLSGLLPNPKLETSVLSISLNTCGWVYMIPMGLSATVSVRVSNELGAGRPRAARLAVCVALFLVVTEGVVMGTMLIVARRVWGYCYSNEEKVISYVAKMLILIAVSHFLDGIQSILSGSARGCGWQKIGAFVNLGAYYLLGIPCALLLAFVFHFGGKGLWVGLIVALFAQSLSLSIITLCTDWDNKAKKASERVYDTSISVEQVS